MVFLFPRSPFLSATPLSFSAVDQSGSVGSGQPLVNAIRTDSAVIGGTELILHLSLHLFHLVLLCLYWTSLSGESQRFFLLMNDVHLKAAKVKKNPSEV